MDWEAADGRGQDSGRGQPAGMRGTSWATPGELSPLLSPFQPFSVAGRLSNNVGPDFLLKFSVTFAPQVTLCSHGSNNK